MKKQKFNTPDTNHSTERSRERQIIIAGVFLFIILVIFLIVEIRSINTQVSSFNESLIGVTNNKHFSKIDENMRESVFMVAVPLPSEYDPSLMEATYTDNMGQMWKIGTGFVIKSDEKYSYILTAHHVIKGSTVMSIISKDLMETKATFYSSFPQADLAIIRVETKLPTVKIGKFNDIKVGSKVAFIGYPLNDPVVQVTHGGVISFIGAQDGMPLITVNSFVNKGNSGGPLFLSDTGEVIGLINAREFKPVPIEPLKIPENSSIENKIIIENEQKIFELLSHVSESVQMGIGRARPINQELISRMTENPN